MKKLLLLFTAGIVASGVHAQVAEKSLIFADGKHNVKSLPAEYSNLVNPSNKENKKPYAQKSTGAGGDRWYSQYDIVNTLNGDIFNTSAANSFVFPIWFDSTIQVKYSTGYGSINFASVNQLIDPIKSNLFNDPGFAPEITISATDAYKVDSVSIRGAYVLRPGKQNVVDTLIVSVAPSTPAAYRIPRSYNTTGNYLPAGKDTLFAFTQKNVDSVQRALFSDVASTNGITWKIPMTPADGDTVSPTGYTTHYYTYAVPNGGLNVPAGSIFNFSYTFKSGDTWVKNVDSVAMHNIFMPIASYVTKGQSPYYYFTDNERSLPGMMFTTDTNSYLPNIYIEIINSTNSNFAYQFFDMAAHVVCSTCELLDVATVNKPVAVGNAYPNPANTEVLIPFTMKSSGDVNVSVSNTLGQVVKTQNMGKYNAGQAGAIHLSTGDLANGLYIYTVESNGQRSTGRVVITH